MQTSAKAIIFDLDNTLIDRDGAFEACVLETFPGAQEREMLRAVDCSGLGSRQTLFELWEQLSDEPMNQERFVSKLVSHLRPEPGLLAWLQGLKEKHKIALLSNGGSESQWAKIRAAGLHQVFSADHICISAELGFEKPDPRIFHLACQIVGENPQDCLYVGDLEDVDGQGARDAGLQFQRMWRV